MGGFAEGLSAGAGGVTAARSVYLGTSWVPVLEQAAWAKDVLPQSRSSAFPCPNFTAVFVKR